MFLMSSCVERSQKYKALQARLDSLNTVHTAQTAELEGVFAEINEISEGMQSLREAENLLTLEAANEKASGNRSRQQLARLKNDIQAITEAIEGYKTRVAQLEGRNKSRSAEYRRLIAGLNAELDLRAEKINELSQQLEAANRELAAKTEEINSLTQNVDSLDRANKSQQMTIAGQDRDIHTGSYRIGTRKELKEVGIISRKGIFCPPIVTSQIERANFQQIDIRETKSLPLQSKKAKILSTHPETSYTLEAGEDGNLILNITDENAFWQQTKYLVVMI